MIQSLKVTGLNGHMTFNLQFHPDINVITGRNGSGKTTVLKLLWYALSGNLKQLAKEIQFESFELQTDNVFVKMEKRESPKTGYYLTFIVDRKLQTVQSIQTNEDPIDPIEGISFGSGSSFYFPTFRRIEGGYSLTNPARRGINKKNGLHSINTPENTEILEAMNALSERLSIADHRFVASISTDDIRQFLSLKYAEISEKKNKLNMALSEFILSDIHNKTGKPSFTNSAETLEKIQKETEVMVQKSEQLIRPFTVLADYASKILQYKGIEITGPVTLGTASQAIASDALSAGEKQMLSFLSYNAFADHASIFIDEPETSLHVDWQRILFPTLLRQSTTNQFIVATHSPFIYSKYADKELLLAEDRGEDNANPTTHRNGVDQYSSTDEPADIVG